MPAYADLASVYEFLTPEPLLTPEGNVAAFAPWIDALPAGARVLDCAAGVGLLAVGLALRGFDVEASDASPEMVERTRALGVRARVRVVGGLAGRRLRRGVLRRQLAPACAGSPRRARRHGPRR